MKKYRFTYEDMQEVFELVICPLFIWSLILCLTISIFFNTILGIVLGVFSFLLVWFLSKRAGFI